MLLAEDDPDDQLLVREALEQTGLPHRLVTVDDGQALLDYLEASKEGGDSLRPDIILLDLNLPLMSGQQALASIKADTSLCSIPVVILTTSKANEDVQGCYASGVAGFVTKPVAFDDLVSVIRGIDSYWFQTVRLPPK
jgi:CheY-like chemotaxis protein